MSALSRVRLASCYPIFNSFLVALILVAPAIKSYFFLRVSQRPAPSNSFTSVGNRAWRQRIGRVQGGNTRLHRLLCTLQQLQVVGRLLLQNRVPVLSCQVVGVFTSPSPPCRLTHSMRQMLKKGAVATVLDILYTRLDGWLQPWYQSYDSILFTIITTIIESWLCFVQFFHLKQDFFRLGAYFLGQSPGNNQLIKIWKKADFAADNRCKTHANILFGSRARILLLANMAAKSARQKNIQHRKHIKPDF